MFPVFHVHPHVPFSLLSCEFQRGELTDLMRALWEGHYHVLASTSNEDLIAGPVNIDCTSQQNSRFFRSLGSFSLVCFLTHVKLCEAVAFPHTG